MVPQGLMDLLVAIKGVLSVLVTDYVLVVFIEVLVLIEEVLEVLAVIERVRGVL